MRYKKKIKVDAKEGTRRDITKFAWLPIAIKYNGVKHTRWLENVTIGQVFAGNENFNYWMNLRFMD